MNKVAFIISLSLICFASIAKNCVAQDAEIVLLNGNVVTVDSDKPTAEAVAIQGNTFIVVGSEKEVRKRIGKSTKVIDLKGKTVVPGFIESHAHIQGIGDLLSELNMMEAKSWQEIVDMVAEAAKSKKKGEWIVGRGWHQSLWDKMPKDAIDDYPIHDAISKVTPNNPVLLTHRSGHMSFANMAAMQKAGVSKSTRAPSGGEILRKSNDDPTGIFRETAQSLISRAFGKDQSQMTAAEINTRFVNRVKLASEHCLKHGVTTFCDAGSHPQTVRSFRKLYDSGQIDLRLWVMLRANNATLAAEIPKLDTLRDYANHHLMVGGIKQMLDGALGAHGAWLLAPYEDLPSSSGLNVTPIETIRSAAELAFKHDLQLCVHAIGDKANREMLDLFEEFSKKTEGERKLRWRIEHAQHLHPDDIPRFSELGVIASMQAVHCTSDAPFVPTRLGNKRSQEGAYVWQSLLKSGAKIANGTDAPVEPVDPLISFRSSVIRKTKAGKAFYQEQAMTREQALRSYTLDAAYAIFREDQLGSIKVGKLADVVVLSNDIMTVPEKELAKTKVEMTIVSGQVVYQSDEAK